MTTLIEKMEHDILSLSPEERAFLADRLLSSLDDEVLSDVDVAWVAEAERRYREHKEGKRETVPAESVFEDADRLLK
jgi:putative addiction module component (TIGR02574 family)